MLFLKRKIKKYVSDFMCSYRKYRSQGKKYDEALRCVELEFMQKSPLFQLLSAEQPSEQRPDPDPVPGENEDDKICILAQAMWQSMFMPGNSSREEREMSERYIRNCLADNYGVNKEQ